MKFINPIQHMRLIMGGIDGLGGHAIPYHDVQSNLISIHARCAICFDRMAYAVVLQHSMSLMAGEHINFNYEIYVYYEYFIIVSYLFFFYKNKMCPASNLIENKAWSTSKAGENKTTAIVELRNATKIIAIELTNHHTAFLVTYD